MTDLQFQLLDELYFVASFPAILQESQLPENTLVQELEQLWQKGWLKVMFPDPDTEIPYQAGHLEGSYHSCYFLASKAGLLAHNSR